MRYILWTTLLLLLAALPASAQIGPPEPRAAGHGYSMGVGVHNVVSRWMPYDYDIARNRMVELIVPPRTCNADENVNVSCGGRYVYVMHCQEGNANYTGVYDLATKTWTPIHGDVPWYDNLQSGANPASIAYGRFYHILFYTLVARTTQQEARR